MATITDKTASGSKQNMSQYVSAAAGPTDSVDLTGLDHSFTHCFLGIQMFDGAGAQIDAGVATGSFAVTIGTANSGLPMESPPTSSINAAAAETIDWASNTERVKVVPSALTGVTTWRVVLTMNKD